MIDENFIFIDSITQHFLTKFIVMDIQLLKNIAQEFNNIISSRELDSPVEFTYEDLYDSKNIIVNGLHNNKFLDLFLKNFFPQDNQLEYHHFTTIEALQGILESSRIRLTSVAKRFSEKEFNPFYDVHGMDGYAKRLNNENKTLAEEIVEDAFYISMTHKDIKSENAQHMWEAFSHKNGIRLVFKISNVQTHLRPVYYPDNVKDKSIPLLQDFIDVVKKFDRELVFNGLSTIGFFYLPGILKCEEEYRLLVKRDLAENCNLQFGKWPNGYEYVELPLFHDRIAHIEITKVFIEENNDERVRKILDEHSDFNAVSIVHI